MASICLWRSRREKRQQEELLKRHTDGVMLVSVCLSDILHLASFFRVVTDCHAPPPLFLILLSFGSERDSKKQRKMEGKLSKRHTDGVILRMASICLWRSRREKRQQKKEVSKRDADGVMLVSVCLSDILH